MNDTVRAWPIDRKTTIKTALGFGVAFGLLYALGAVIGWEAVVYRLREADGGWLGAAGLSTILCLVAWGKVWEIVLDTVGISVRFRRLLVTFFAGTFANYVTPMGQAGGEPLVAYLLAQDMDVSYEASLASIVTADALRLLPFFNIGLVGLGYVVIDGRLTERTDGIAVALLALAVAIPVTIGGVWWFRYAVRDAVVRSVAPIAGRADRLDPDALGDRVDRLIEAIERIADSPRALAVALVITYLGWVLFAAPLYFSGLALGIHVSPLLVAFVVPATVIAGSTPTPGGLAAIEGALAVLLASLAAVSAGEALAIALLYRLASYWLVLVVGGVAFLWVLKRA